MGFECEIPVAYGDVDYARIVYYPRYLHYVHLAMEALFRDVVGVAYDRVLGTERVGYPTVKVEAEFLAPVAYGESLAMTVTVERVGTKSVTFRNEGRRTSDGRLAFVVTNVTVAVDMDRWESIEVPREHRAALERV
jgi:4-hydroxybenzoyl-CoA thioesterase